MGLLDNSIIDLGVEKATDKLADGKWVDALAKRAYTDVIPRLPGQFTGQAGQAVDRIVLSKGALGTVTSRTFLKITTYLGMGLEDEARLLYLRERATFDERQASLKKAMGLAYDANLAGAQAWDEVKATALDVLKLAGQVAIPLILTAL